MRTTTSSRVWDQSCRSGRVCEARRQPPSGLVEDSSTRPTNQPSCGSIAARRAGFTLIELLIVVAILAALAALVAGGISAVRSSQQTRVTEDHLAKLQTALDQQWKAVLDQVRDDGKNQKIDKKLIDFCGGDDDRAKALWAYIKLRQEFPQTFQEARTPFTLATAQGPYVLQPRQTFASVPNVATGNPTGEAAALFYLMLSEKGNRGMVFSADDAGGQGEIDLGGNRFRVFKDGWGNPITFVRFCALAEVNAAPYAKPFTPRVTNPPSVTIDPLDPLIKLDDNTWANKAAAQNALGLVFSRALNRMPVLASAGPDKKWPGESGNTPDSEVYSHRLKRVGDGG